MDPSLPWLDVSCVRTPAQVPSLAEARYRRTRTATASPRELVFEAYAATLGCLERALGGDLEALLRAHALLAQLRLSLEPDSGSEHGRALEALYDRLRARLAHAYVAQDLEGLAELPAILRAVRDTLGSCVEGMPLATHGPSWSRTLQSDA